MKKEKTTLPRNRDGVWAAIREQKTFTIKQIADRVGLPRWKSQMYIRPLQKAGYIERLGNKAGHSFLYRLVKDIGKHGPEMTKAGNHQPPTGQQRMWVAMKVLKRFSHRDISLTAEVDNATASHYCNTLKRACYLSQDGYGEIFCFNHQKDTGLYAPRLIGKRKSLQVYDRNLNKIVWPEIEAA